MAGGMQLIPYYRNQLDPEFLRWYPHAFTTKRPGYIHWTAGPRDVSFDDYHRVYTSDARGVHIFTNTDVMIDLHAHTYHRNTGSFSVSVASMHDATSDHFGDECATPQQIIAMLDDLVAVCQNHRIPVSMLMSHQEAADNMDYYPQPNSPEAPHDPYGPLFGSCERWDWFAYIDSTTKQISPVFNKSEWLTISRTARAAKPPKLPFMDWLRGEAALRLQAQTEAFWHPRTR
jgi:hypothetical protein